MILSCVWAGTSINSVTVILNLSELETGPGYLGEGNQRPSGDGIRGDSILLVLGMNTAYTTGRLLSDIITSSNAMKMVDVSNHCHFLSLLYRYALFV